MPISAISVSIDDRAFRAIVGGMLPPALDRAVARALRDTQNNARNRASTVIARHMGITRAGSAGTSRELVKRYIISPFVPVGAYETELRASRRAIPLGAFHTTGGRAGVTTTAWGKRQTIAHAFMATMPSGHRGAFVRRGAKRLPIRELWGPTVSGTFTAPVPRATIEATIRAQYPKNLARQIKREAFAAARGAGRRR